MCVCGARALYVKLFVLRHETLKQTTLCGMVERNLGTGWLKKLYEDGDRDFDVNVCARLRMLVRS